MTEKTTTPRKVAIIGGGVIGGGWAARFLLNGWDVAVFDPDPDADRKLAEILANARISLPALADAPMPAEGQLTRMTTISAAVSDADWIQESVPERLEMKHEVFRLVQRSCRSDAVIASSTSGFRPGELKGGAMRPEQIIVAHPFNPVNLLPLVELVPGDSPATLVERAKATLSGLGMCPLHVRHEIDAHIADRLLEAVWREALWLIRDGIATTEDIDDAIRMGFGLRWAQMGLFETYRIAGGEAGMKHFLEQFGPCLSWPWTRLMDVPDLDEALVDLIVDQSDAQSGMHSIRELERIRDGNLLGFLRVLKDRDWGAGKILREHDARLRAAFREPGPEPSAPLTTVHMRVLPGWIDSNGHMTESHYLFAASETSDAFLRLIGVDMDYVAGGHSYCTAESRMMHLGVARPGDALTGTIQLLSADEKRLHVFIRILKGDVPVAMIEQVLLHVDIKAGRNCPAAQSVLDRLAPIIAAQASLSPPEVAGQHTERRKS